MDVPACEELVNRVMEGGGDHLTYSFYDYRYNEEDKGLIKYIPDREAMYIYIGAIVRAAYKSGLLYTTFPQREGYLILSGEGVGAIGFVDGM